MKNKSAIIINVSIRPLLISSLPIQCMDEHSDQIFKSDIKCKCRQYLTIKFNTMDRVNFISNWNVFAKEAIEPSICNFHILLIVLLKWNAERLVQCLLGLHHSSYVNQKKSYLSSSGRSSTSSSSTNNVPSLSKVCNLLSSPSLEACIRVSINSGCALRRSLPGQNGYNIKWKGNILCQI